MKEKTMVEKLKEILDNQTPEEHAATVEFFRDKTPKGWLSIEEHLPKFRAMDIMQGCSIYKVRYADGHEDETCVSDHTMWYYLAKEEGIVEWLNE